MITPQMQRVGNFTFNAGGNPGGGNSLQHRVTIKKDAGGMGRIIQRDNMPIGQPAQLKRVWRDQLRPRDQLLGDGPCQGFIAIKPAMVTKGRDNQNRPARSVKSAEGILNGGDLPDMADIPGHDCIQPIPPVQAFYPHDN